MQNWSNKATFIWFMVNWHFFKNNKLIKSKPDSSKFVKISKYCMYPTREVIQLQKWPEDIFILGKQWLMVPPKFLNVIHWISPRYLLLQGPSICTILAFLSQAISGMHLSDLREVTPKWARQCDDLLSRTLSEIPDIRWISEWREYGEAKFCCQLVILWIPIPLNLLTLSNLLKYKLNLLNLKKISRVF